MNRYQLLVSIGLLASVGAAAQTIQSTSKPQIIALSQIFIPPGFDDYDNAQVIVRGYMPNTCYKIAPPLAHVDQANQTIYIAAQAYPTKQALCSEMLVSFSQTIDLGRLPAGNYQVIQLNPNGTAGLQAQLTVAESQTGGPNDYLFASVNQSFVDMSLNPAQIHVIGTLPSPCLYLQEVRVLHRAAHIVEVLPIVGRHEGATCSPNPVPFDVTRPLPSVEPGPWLLYTRSINGQALSSVEMF
jgi:hypothetical protein